MDHLNPRSSSTEWLAVLNQIRADCPREVDFGDVRIPWQHDRIFETLLSALIQSNDRHVRGLLLLLFQEQSERLVITNDRCAPAFAPQDSFRTLSMHVVQT